jgi:hypothetical protein
MVIAIKISILCDIRPICWFSLFDSKKLNVLLYRYWDYYLQVILSILVHATYTSNLI